MSTPIRVTSKTMQKIRDHIEAEEKKAVEILPTVENALQAICYAKERLRSLGFADALYAPKDGSSFEILEFGSTGIHEGFYEGEWPNGSFQIVCEDGDTGSSHPIMYRPKQ